MKRVLSYLLVILFSFLLLSYKLTEVPDGITTDEAAFGYNAVLLSETGHDENGKFMPLFVHSLSGTDWRQPIAQYWQTLVFFAFGASLYTFKLSSVFIAVLSVVLFVYLVEMIFGSYRYGILGGLLLITTPVFVIHSHMGLDNNMVLPFTMFWLISIIKYQKTNNNLWLVLSGISLGLGFYAHKSMRSFSTMWALSTMIYIFALHKNKTELFIKKSIIFSLAIIPFYVAIPLIEKYYDGAIGFAQATGVRNLHDYFLSFLSSFDLSFLFVTGDTIIHHSTGQHGAYLLAVLPLFLLGLSKSYSSKFYTLLLTAFVLGPVLIGMTGSVHRSSRLIAMVPIVLIFCLYGLSSFMKFSNYYKYIFVTFLVLVILNACHFYSYYWYIYPQESYGYFNRINLEKSYIALKNESALKTALIDYDLVKVEGDTSKFVRSMYFLNLPEIYDPTRSESYSNHVLLTNKTEILDYNSKVKIDDEMYLYFLGD